jgi:hypothetical protein
VTALESAARFAIMTKAVDLYAIALRSRELARTKADGPLRKRRLDWAWRCDKMAKALELPTPRGNGAANSRRTLRNRPDRTAATRIRRTLLKLRRILTFSSRFEPDHVGDGDPV